jgi:transposase
LDIRRHLDEGVPLKVLATQAGIGLRSAYTWGARFNRVGHRITCDPRTGSSPGAGYEKVLVAVDDATRLAIVEVWADEKGPTTVGFLSRAAGWFNGSAYKCHGWRKAAQAMGLKAKKTRHCTPRTNGKAERFITTLLEALGTAQLRDCAGLFT